MGADLNKRQQTTVSWAVLFHTYIYVLLIKCPVWFMSFPDHRRTEKQAPRGGRVWKEHRTGLQRHRCPPALECRTRTGAAGRRWSAPNPSMDRTASLLTSVWVRAQKSAPCFRTGHGNKSHHSFLLRDFKCRKVELPLVRGKDFRSLRPAQTKLVLNRIVITSSTREKIWLYWRQCESSLAVSRSFSSHGLSPWSSPGQDTGVGCDALLQGSSQPRDRT